MPRHVLDAARVSLLAPTDRLPFSLALKSHIWIYCRRGNLSVRSECCAWYRQWIVRDLATAQCIVNVKQFAPKRSAWISSPGWIGSTWSGRLRQHHRLRAIWHLQVTLSPCSTATTRCSTMITWWQISENILNASLALGTEIATGKSLRRCGRSWVTPTTWAHCNATGSALITIPVYLKCLHFSWTIRLLTDSFRAR